MRIEVSGDLDNNDKAVVEVGFVEKNHHSWAVLSVRQVRHLIKKLEWELADSLHHAAAAKHRKAKER